MPPCLDFSRKACCVFLMEGKPLMSANKAQPAYFKSLAQFAQKSQVSIYRGGVSSFCTNIPLSIVVRGLRGMP